MMRAMSLMTRTISLRHKLLKSAGLNTDQQSRADLLQSARYEDSNETDETILRACFEALEEFDGWDLEAETYWKHTFEGRSIPAALGKLATGATYYDPKTACTIILVRSARLILLLSILEYYDMIRVSNSETDAWNIGDKAAWANCVPILQQTIRLTIDDMLWCVPFAMGDVDLDGRPVSMSYDGAAALMIIQPVRLVTYCAYATPEQRKRSQDILDRMKSAIGVKSAISWEEQDASTPQRPGTAGLVRAMTLLATTGTPTPSSTTH
jgi:hypothetical protein